MTLLDHQLLVTSGKGGVGKSTVTAALALVAASRGKRVLVCEVNTRERISALLGCRAVGEEIRPLSDGIDAVVVRPQSAMREYALMKLKFQAVYHAVFENRFVSRFLRFIPSLNEIVMLGKILYHVRERRWDLVLLDAPSTGHAITFLRIPRMLLDTVPPGPLRSDGEWMQELLEDPSQTALNLVSLPEELPVTETLELAEATRDVLHMKLGQVFLNGFRKRCFEDAERQMINSVPPAGEAALTAVLAAARSYVRRAQLSERYQHQLRDSLGLPVTALPFVCSPTKFGRADVERLAAAMDEDIK